MGTWVEGTPSSYTVTDYQVGWLDYTGTEVVTPFYYDSGTSAMTDEIAANFADNLVDAEGATILHGAHSGAVKYTTLVTTTQYTYTP